MKFENTETMNFENAIRGMRNPMDSWSKSDSGIKKGSFVLGVKDLTLAKNLVKSGNEHRKFLRQVFVSVDITAPRYWWQEFDTYKVGTSANSCSTMHTITKKPFTMDMFASDYINQRNDFIMEFVLSHLNALRTEYNETKDKAIFRAIKQILPESFLQKRTVTFNYENALNMYRQRKNHRLYEWRDFCNWVKDLPYMKDFLGVFDED